MKKRCFFIWLFSLIVCLMGTGAACAGENQLTVSTFGEGITVYSSHTNGKKVGTLYNGFESVIALDDKNGMYSCYLTRDMVVWLNQDRAMEAYPRSDSGYFDRDAWRAKNHEQPCHVFLAEVCAQDAHLYSSTDHKTIVAKHMPGTLVEVYGDFGGDYYVRVGVTEGFVAKEDVRFYKQLTATNLFKDKTMGLTPQEHTVYTGGGELAIGYSATGYCAEEPAYVKNGEKVQVIKYLGDWAQLSNGAFIETRFLEPEGDHSIRYATVVSSKLLNRLNVRWSPEEDARVEVKLFSGAKVQVPSFTDEWAAVFISGPKGGGRYKGSANMEFLVFDDTQVKNACMRVVLAEMMRAEHGSIYESGKSRGDALKAGDVLTVMGVVGESWQDIDRFLCLTEDGRLVTIVNSKGVLQPLERLGITAKVKSNVRFRERPDQESKALRTLSKGAKVEILLRGEIWTMIEYKDVTGYVMSRYLNFP